MLPAPHTNRHPEEPRPCAASRRMATRTGARGPSFEARREERRAPQDDGSVCCRPVGRLPRLWSSAPRRNCLTPGLPMSNINPDPFPTRPEIEGTFGVVTSTHWIATAVGMATLEKSGNAFDAGAATAFTLQVVEPHLNGPGGDVPVIVHDVKRGRTEVICGQGPAPQGASIAHYRSLGLDIVPGTGLLAACVPGTFDTWMLLLRDYGTMRLSDVLAPAIGYARNGHPLLERASATIATVADLFREHWPTSAAVYLPHGAVPEPGVMFRNPVLADTYTRILREAEHTGDRVAQIEHARRS